MQKGTKKIAGVASLFSERVKAELAIIRLRLRIDEVQAGIDELHRRIGRKVTDLKKQEALPRTTEQLFRDDELTTAVAELADREQEVEELKARMKDVQTEFRAAEKQTEDILA